MIMHVVFALMCSIKFVALVYNGVTGYKSIIYHMYTYNSQISRMDKKH